MYAVHEPTTLYLKSGVLLKLMLKRYELFRASSISNRSLAPEGRMRMLLKGTDRTLFGIRRLVAIWRRLWTIGYDLWFLRKFFFFLFSLVRHAEPTDQNCLDLFYQRKEKYCFFVPETFKIKNF